MNLPGRHVMLDNFASTATRHEVDYLFARLRGEQPLNRPGRSQMLDSLAASATSDEIAYLRAKWPAIKMTNYRIGVTTVVGTTDILCLEMELTPGNWSRMEQRDAMELALRAAEARNA